MPILPYPRCYVKTVLHVCNAALFNSDSDKYLPVLREREREKERGKFRARGEAIKKVTTQQEEAALLLCFQCPNYMRAEAVLRGQMSGSPEGE